MNLTDYPALEGFDTALPPRLSYQRAIWGKVEGQRSDFRVIARSQNFKADFQGLIPALRVGAEEQAGSAPFWRYWQGRYYAVWAYPSRATDATGRYGFLEKQIIEWEPTGLPAALGALVLLPLVMKKPPEDYAVSKASDSRWRNSDFWFPLDPGNEPLPRLESLGVALVQDGLAYLNNLSDEALEGFFAAIRERQQPAFLASAEPFKPATLGILLLPFDRERADQLSLAGWVPSNRIEREELRGWDGVVCSPTQQPQQATTEIPLDTEIKAAQQALMLRRLHPAVGGILDFAYGPKRWFDPSDPAVRSDISTLVAGGRATEAELAYLRAAIDRARRVAESNSGLPEKLEEARRRHLLSKVDVLRALELIATAKLRPEATEPRITEILEIWSKSVQQGQLRQRIEYVLQQVAKPAAQ